MGKSQYLKCMVKTIKSRGRTGSGSIKPSGDEPQVVVVAVKEVGGNSEAAFQSALTEELRPQDKLVIINCRPFSSVARQDAHSTESLPNEDTPAMEVHKDDQLAKKVPSLKRKQSDPVLAYYAAMASNAGVQFEAIQVEGKDWRDAVSKKCTEVGGSMLLIGTGKAGLIPRFLRGGNHDFCPLCHPFRTIPSCPVVSVKRKGLRWNLFDMSLVECTPILSISVARNGAALMGVLSRL